MNRLNIQLSRMQACVAEVLRLTVCVYVRVCACVYEIQREKERQ